MKRPPGRDSFGRLKREAMSRGRGLRRREGLEGGLVPALAKAQQRL